MRTPPRTPSRTNALQKKSSVLRLLMNHSLAIFLGLALFWGCWLFHMPMPEHHTSHPTDFIPENRRSETKALANGGTFLKAFEDVIMRAKKNLNHCDDIMPEEQAKPEPTEDVIAIANITTERLPGFGVIKALEDWRANPVAPTHIANGATNTQCEVPPENECGAKQFTAIFMAYNPDRLKKLLGQMRTMLAPPYSSIVQEIVIVWNGPRHVDESDLGKELISLSQEKPDHVRIVYPLKQGLPNDLMNRYHPDIVQVKTKGILYYDDDGPFYSYEAVLGGFELWKRNSNAQIGAMARVIDLGPRQQAEKKQMLPAREPLNDRAFISHCAPDDVEYNFRFFANFQANMVLPSGSFLHSNYLCFLWHAAFEPIREYVRAHPVHPDDMTVSMMVSQLAGRAPKVYSRRINPETKEAQLKEAARLKEAGQPLRLSAQRRKLLFGIDWDKDHNMNDDKEKWAQLRSGAVNSLVRYFGSMNSGSIGWCFGTEYHQKNKQGEDYCNPEMARFGKLPWLNIDHTVSDICP